MAQVVEAVLVSGDKVLLVQQVKPSAKGLWSYPGGLVEQGESLEKALIREVKEELGVDLINPKQFKEYKLVSNMGPFTITTYTGSIKNQKINLETDELMAYGWFSLKEMQDMAISLRGDIVLNQAKDVLAKTSEQG